MISIKKIAKLIGGDIYGDESFNITNICDIESGKKHCITYIDNKKYLKFLKNNLASAVIVNSNFKIDQKKIYIKVKNPSLSFIKVMNLFSENKEFENKICKTSSIHKTATIGNNVYIGSNVSINKNVFIRDNVKIYPNTYIGENCSIGKNSNIFSNVSIYHDCIIGADCKVDSGTVIGSDGFGLTKDEEKNISIPHLGKVIIKNDVSIGANCCIDRGTINDTIISDNCRLDNLVQIAHNVNIGKGCVIAGQVGIAGSTVLEDYVIIAGQVGIIDHLLIGKYTIITAKSLVCNSTDKKSFLSGNPAQPHRDFLKQQLLLRNLNKD